MSTPVKVKSYEEYLEPEAPIPGDDEADLLRENILGPRPGQDLFALVSALAKLRRIAPLESLYSGRTALHEVIKDAVGFKYGEDFVSAYGPPFRPGEHAGVHATRALAALGLVLASDDPKREWLYAALAWHQQARSAPTLPVPWTPGELAGDDARLDRRLELLAETAGPQRHEGFVLSTAVTLRCLANPAAEPSTTMLLKPDPLARVASPAPPGNGPRPDPVPKTRRATRRRLRGLAEWARPAGIGITVLFDQGQGGTKARLRVAAAKGLPACLMPNPERMSVFAADQTFRGAVDRAWEQAGQNKIRSMVLWSAEPADGPQRSAEGESLGAAFAVVLDELRRLQQPLATFLVIRRLVSGNAVIGRIDGLGYMQGVEGYDSKLEAYGGPGKVIIPQTDHQKAVAAARRVQADLRLGPGDIELAPAGRWRQAAAEARRSNWKIVVRNSVAVVTLAAAVAGTAIGIHLHGEAGAATSEASRQAAAALSGRLAALAVANLNTHLDIAQLLAVEATRLDNTPQARAALFRAATANPPVERFFQAGSKITAVAVASDGLVAAAGTSDGHLVRFDLVTGARAEVMAGGRPIQSVAISGNGHVVAAASGSSAVIWEPGGAPSALPVRGHAFMVALSPSGHLAAILSTVPGPAVQTATGPSAPELLTVRNIQKHRQVTTAPIIKDWSGQVRLPPTPAVLGTGPYYTELAFPSESMLTLTAMPGTFTDYAPSDLRVIKTGSLILAAHTGQVPGDSVNGTFYGVWNYVGAIVSEGSGGQTHLHFGQGPTGVPSGLTFSDDGKFAATVGGGTITVTTMTGTPVVPGRSGRKSTQLTANADTSAVAFAGDGQLVSVSGSSLELWNLSSGLEIGAPVGLRLAGAQTQEFADPLAMSPDSRYLAVGDVNNSTLTVAPAGESAHLYLVRNSPAATVAEKGLLHGTVFWSGNQLLQIGGAGNRIQIATTAGVVLGSWQVPAHPTFWSSAFRAIGHNRIVILSGGAIVSVDPRTRATTDRPITISGIPRPKGSQLFAVAISQDATKAVFQQFSGSDTLVYVDLGTGSARVMESGQARFVQFADDRLFVGLYNGQEQVWDAADDHLVRSFPEAGTNAFGLAVSPDGTLLSQVSNDGVASIIDTASGQVIASFHLPPSQGAAPDPWAITTTTFTPDDQYLFTATPGAALTRWDIGEHDLINLACYRAGSSLTPAVWDQYIQAAPPPRLACGRPISVRPAAFPMSRSSASPSSSVPTSSPVGTPSAAATVKAYYAAINEHQYHRAWELGAKNLDESYASFVAGFAGTSHDNFKVTRVDGNIVTANLTAIQSNGSRQLYVGTYTVTDHVITKFNVEPTE